MKNLLKYILIVLCLVFPRIWCMEYEDIPVFHPLMTSDDKASADKKVTEKRKKLVQELTSEKPESRDRKNKFTEQQNKKDEKKNGYVDYSLVGEFFESFDADESSGDQKKESVSLGFNKNDILKYAVKYLKKNPDENLLKKGLIAIGGIALPLIYRWFTSDNSNEKDTKQSNEKVIKDEVKSYPQWMLLLRDFRNSLSSSQWVFFPTVEILMEAQNGNPEVIKSDKYKDLENTSSFWNSLSEDQKGLAEKVILEHKSTIQQEEKK